MRELDYQKRKKRIKYLYYEKFLSMAQIGKIYEISRERVRQLMEGWGYARRTLSEIGRTRVGLLVRKQICADYRRGLDFSEICWNCSLGQSVVYRVLAEGGIELTSRAKRRVDFKFTRSQQAGICRDYSRGLLFGKIGKKYGATLADIHRIIYVWKEPLRPRGAIWSIPSQRRELTGRFFRDWAKLSEEQKRIWKEAISQGIKKYWAEVRSGRRVR